MAARKNKRYSVYLLRCADGTLYTGIALDVAARVAQHNAGKGARYTRGRGPVRVVASRVIGNRGAAQRAEAALKRLPRAAKPAALRDRGALPGTRRRQPGKDGRSRRLMK